MRNSSPRLTRLLKLMASEGFQNKCRFLKISHFTRKRKMPLHKLLLTTLFRKGRSLKIELKEFSAKLGKVEISKVGYLKQRIKLNPMSFLELARFYAKQFYKDRMRVKTYKGHLVGNCQDNRTPKFAVKFVKSVPSAILTRLKWTAVCSPQTECRWPFRPYCADDGTG